MDRFASLFNHLREASLELAWGQWTSAGVAGVHEGAGALLDPEALLLASLTLGRYDARLLDEVLDWLVANSRLLDLARLRRLRDRAGSSERQLLTVAARLVAARGGAPNFGHLLADEDSKRGGTSAAGTVTAESATAESADAEPLFYSMGTRDATWGGFDPLFASAGFLRPPVRLRGLSGRPAAGNPACLRFQVRALVGLGSRAEVLVYLLTHGWTHGRLIAERTAYGQAPVAACLAALLEMRLVDRREEGKKVLYQLSDGIRKAFPARPLYVDWIRVWPALVALLEALRPSELSAQMTEEARWIRLATALDASEASLRAEGFDVAVDDLGGWALRGPDVLRAAVDRVVARVEELAA